LTAIWLKAVRPYTDFFQVAFGFGFAVDAIDFEERVYCHKLAFYLSSSGMHRPFSAGALSCPGDVAGFH
jgi:hypothetical protein